MYVTAKETFARRAAYAKSARSVSAPPTANVSMTAWTRRVGTSVDPRCSEEAMRLIQLQCPPADRRPAELAPRASEHLLSQSHRMNQMPKQRATQGDSIPVREDE